MIWRSRSSKVALSNEKMTTCFGFYAKARCLKQQQARRVQDEDRVPAKYPASRVCCSVTAIIRNAFDEGRGEVGAMEGEELRVREWA